MPQLVYRYTFAEAVPAEEVEVTIVLALIATEALHGAAQARLDAVHAFDGTARTVAIDASTVVGRDLNKLFAGFLEPVMNLKLYAGPLYWHERDAPRLPE